MKFIKKLGELILRALDPEDSLSVKRVALLISLIYFAISSFGIFIIGSILSFRETKGMLPVMVLYSAQTSLIVKYNFWIVASLIGAISIDDVGKALVENTKVTLPDINTSPDDGGVTIVQNAENMDSVDTVTAQNVDTINADIISTQKS